MRFTPNAPMSTAQVRFRAGNRPERLPAELAELIAEHDKITTRVNDARTRSGALGDPGLDRQAEADDLAAASKAARGGKPAPAPAAARKLEEDREQAERDLVALEQARSAVVDELRNLASRLYHDSQDAEKKRRDAARAAILEQAEALASAVTQEVRTQNDRAWLRSGYLVRDANARIYATAVAPELGRMAIHPQDRRSLTRAGEAITRAALAAITDPEGD